VYAVDLHSHTRFFHGHERAAEYYDPLGVRLLTEAARLRNLDGVALTNHDYYREFDVAGTVPGIEVTTTHGHVLVVGPNPPSQTEPGDLSPEEAVEMAHDRGCAAIIAHPYRNSTVKEVDADFDAIEINGKHPRTEQWVRKLADTHDLPLVGGSDAHYPFEVGRAYTEIDAEEFSPEAIVSAIRDGRVESEVHYGKFNRALRTLYRRIHEEKDYLQRPDGVEAESETPGVGKPPQ
jgi:hypothetical protein